MDKVWHLQMIPTVFSFVRPPTHFRDTILHNNHSLSLKSVSSLRDLHTQTFSFLFSTFSRSSGSVSFVFCFFLSSVFFCSSIFNQQFLLERGSSSFCTFSCSLGGGGVVSPELPRDLKLLHCPERRYLCNRNFIFFQQFYGHVTTMQSTLTLSVQLNRLLQVHRRISFS